MKLILIHIFILLNFYPVFGKWTVFTPENSGLPYKAGYDITIDSKDNIWIATLEGLTKFDGEHWITFNIDNSRIPSNSLSAVEIDLNGNVWVGTSSKGIARFDGEKWDIYDHTNSEFGLNRTFDIAVDKNNIIWCGTRDFLKKFDGTEWETIEYETFLPITTVETVEIDTNNDVWFGTRFQGLYKYSNGELVNYNTDNSRIPSNDVVSIAVDSNNNIWLSTDRDHFLCKFNERNNEWTLTKNTDTPEESLFKSLRFDKDNNLFIISTRTMLRYDENNWTIYEVDSLLEEDEKNHVYFREFVFDSQENIWIFASGEGVLKFTPENTSVKSQVNKLKDIYVYPNPSSGTFMIDLSNNVNNNLKGIKIYNIAGKLLRNYYKDNNTFSKKKIESNLQSGVYFLVVETDEQSYLEKIEIIK